MKSNKNILLFGSKFIYLYDDHYYSKKAVVYVEIIGRKNVRNLLSLYRVFINVWTSSYLWDFC